MTGLGNLLIGQTEMNQRVKELVKQAGIDFGNFESVTVDLDQIEEFAKLIVSECAYRARQCYTVRAVDAEDVAQHIEESFGK